MVVSARLRAKRLWASAPKKNLESGQKYLGLDTRRWHRMGHDGQGYTTFCEHRAVAGGFTLGRKNSRSRLDLHHRRVPLEPGVFLDEPDRRVFLLCPADRRRSRRRSGLPPPGRRGAPFLHSLAVAQACSMDSSAGGPHTFGSVTATSRSERGVFASLAFLSSLGARATARTRRREGLGQRQHRRLTRTRFFRPGAAGMVGTERKGRESGFVHFSSRYVAHVSLKRTEAWFLPKPCHGRDTETRGLCTAGAGNRCERMRNSIRSQGRSGGSNSIHATVRVMPATWRERHITYSIRRAYVRLHKGWCTMGCTTTKKKKQFNRVEREGAVLVSLGRVAGSLPRLIKSELLKLDAALVDVEDRFTLTPRRRRSHRRPGLRIPG